MHSIPSEMEKKTETSFYGSDSSLHHPPRPADEPQEHNSGAPGAGTSGSTNTRQNERHSSQGAVSVTGTPACRAQGGDL